MSLYIGTSDHTADLIASTISKATIQKLIAQYFMPKIGDVKYLAVPYFQQVNIAAADFDGWVYADGSTLAVGAADFQQAKTFFGVSPTATRLPVPNLCRFVQASPSNSFKYSYQESDMPCADHKHNINTQISYNTNNGSFILSTAFKVAVTGTGTHCVAPPANASGNVQKLTNDTWSKVFNNLSTYVPCLHGPDREASGSDHRVNVDLNIPAGVDFSMMPTKNFGEDHPDVYPAHVLLAVMVYIGRKGG